MYMCTHAYPTPPHNWTGYKREEDEAGDPLVAGEGEEGQPHVGEDKVFSNKVKQLEHLSPWMEKEVCVVEGGREGYW